VLHTRPPPPHFVLHTGRGPVVWPFPGTFFVVIGLFQKSKVWKINDTWMPGADSAVCIQNQIQKNKIKKKSVAGIRQFFKNKEGGNHQISTPDPPSPRLPHFALPQVEKIIVGPFLCPRPPTLNQKRFILRSCMEGRLQHRKLNFIDFLS